MRFRLKLHNSIGDSCWSLHQSKPSSAITANYNLRFLCGRMLASWGSVTQLNSISLLLFGQSRLSQFLRRPTWKDFFFLIGRVFGLSFIDNELAEPVIVSDLQGKKSLTNIIAQSGRAESCRESRKLSHNSRCSWRILFLHQCRNHRFEIRQKSSGLTRFSSTVA